jgi:hypothetical protein
VGKPAHLEVNIQRCVQLPIQSEPAPLAMKSPADLSGNPSTSGAGLGSEVWVHLLNERTV